MQKSQVVQNRFKKDAAFYKLKLATLLDKTGELVDDFTSMWHSPWAWD